MHDYANVSLNNVYDNVNKRVIRNSGYTLPDLSIGLYFVNMSSSQGSIDFGDDGEIHHLNFKDGAAEIRRGKRDRIVADKRKRAHAHDAETVKQELLEAGIFAGLRGVPVGLDAEEQIRDLLLQGLFFFRLRHAFSSLSFFFMNIIQDKAGECNTVLCHL